MGYLCESSILVVSIIAFVSAGTSRCYTCSGIECNDPFNSSYATIMNCNNISSYRSTSTNEWAEEEDKIFTRLNFNTVNMDDFVCSKYTYTHDYANRNMTIRRCMPRKVDTLDICNYVNQTISSTIGKLMSCSSCDTDLCNAGISFESSLMTISVFCICCIMKFF